MKSASDRSLMITCARFILGESTGVKIKGTPARVEAFQEVLSASRELYKALCSQRPLLEIKTLIEKKNIASAKFRSVTGITWTL